MTSIIEEKSDSLLLAACAKVNLRLEVLRRREDGYHELQMINTPLELHDDLSIRKISSGIRLSVEGAPLPTNANNLAYRAAEALVRLLDLQGGVEMTIVKRIPIAAGLGGGSSDAAAVLRGIDRLFGLNLGEEKLRQIGLALGADVPFFLYGRSAVVRGIGEVLEPFPIRKDFEIVLVNPGFPVGTKDVYRAASSTLTLPQNATTLPPAFEGIDEAVQALRNDLEKIVAPRHPEIDRMKSALMEAGARGAMMSGSGPTVFGLFDGEADRDEIARRLGDGGRDWRIVETRSAAAGCSVPI